MREEGCARQCGVLVAVSTAMALLWWVTAREDAEWQLWRHYPSSLAAANVVFSALLLAAGYVLGWSNGAAIRLARMALTTTAGLVTLAMFEIPSAVLGHDYGQDFGTRQNDTWVQLATGINRPDPDLLFVHTPHSHFKGTVTGNLGGLGLPAPVQYPVDVAYDKNGFRNHVDYTQADIVVIGDSFVEAAEVPEPQTTVARLAQQMDVTVANLGHSGYGPQQELIVLRRYGIPLSPKIVIWVFFGGNDMSDVDAYEWAAQHFQQLLGPRSFSSRSFTRNALIAVARFTTWSRRTATPAARLHAAEFKRASGGTETMYFDAPEYPWSAHQWHVATSTLQSARDLTRQSGADFIVVYVPRKLRVYRGYVHAQPGTVAHVWTLNNLPEVLGAWCRQQGIDFLDATGVLREAVASGESVYLPDDVHWNANGHDVVATALAHRIQHEGHVRVK